MKERIGTVPLTYAEDGLLKSLSESKLMLTGMVPADIKLGTGELAAQLNYRLFLAVHHFADGSNAHDRLVALLNAHVIRIFHRSLGGIRRATIRGFNLDPWEENQQQVARATLDFGVIAALTGLIVGERGDRPDPSYEAEPYERPGGPDFPIHEIYLRLRPDDADFIQVYP